jgi:hypothetical protein
VLKVFVDGSYEGDLMAAAGISFAVGREASVTYNETLAGFTGGSHPQFDRYLSPYFDAGSEPSSHNLLPLVESIPYGLHVGDADGAVASYNFRLCVTNRTRNLIPFVKPEGYNASAYELLRRHFAAAARERALTSTRLLCGVNPRPMPGGGGKHDMNSGCGPVGSDLVGSLAGNGSNSGAAAWASANATERDRIWADHRDYLQGLLWFLGHDPSVPPYVQEPALAWGLCADEFKETGGWPPQLYVREARRMKGGTVMTQHDMAQSDAGDEAIGIGGYVVDTHTARRYACTPDERQNYPAHCTWIPGGPHPPEKLPVATAYVWNEGHMVSDPGLFQLQRGMLLPCRDEATNVVVAGTPSTSHVVFCSIRMEPQFMLIGHAAGVLSALAQDQAATTVQDVSAAKLYATLKQQGQVLQLPTAEAARNPPNMCVLNRCVPVTPAAFQPGATPCQFCSPLAENEWLASVATFGLVSDAVVNVTAMMPAMLVKSLVATAPTLFEKEINADHLEPSHWVPPAVKHVPAGFQCTRVYLQHYRGVWVCAT